MTSQPTSPAGWRQYAQSLFQQGDLAGAEAAFKNSFGANGPQSAADFLSLARFAIFMAQYPKAAEFADASLQLAPNHPEVRLTAARIALFQGDRNRCREEIKHGLQHAPDHPGLIYMALDTLKPLPEGLLQHAEVIAARMAGPTLYFGVARALDRQGEYDRAWAIAAHANQMQNLSGFDQSIAEQRLARAIDVFHAAPPPSAPSALRPIYFTGSPRCGGTLIETLVAAHPSVGSAGERGALIPWLSDAVNTALTSNVEAAAEALSKKRGELAQADAAGLRSAGVFETEITDKTPANAGVAGLLSCVHPAARFVDIDRDLRDTAISIFFHEFPEGYPYSTQLADIIRYLRHRRRVIDSWEDAGLKFSRIRYEDFVASPESQGEQLFKSLGLEWSADYISPQTRTAPARTFSANAVRDEITQTKSGSWRRYADHFPDIEG